MSDKPVPGHSQRFIQLTPSERQQRLEQAIASRPEGPLWVFAFGSLMWNPAFEYDLSAAAVLAGWERKFHIWTTTARGTPENPGLGLCLEKGSGECRGIVYRLRSQNEARDWQALWDREMNSGVYRARWLGLQTENLGAITALTFTVDPAHRQYAGAMPIEDMAAIMAGARGKYGRCRDYLAETIREMSHLGVSDPHLSALLDLVDTNPIGRVRP